MLAFGPTVHLSVVNFSALPWVGLVVDIALVSASILLLCLLTGTLMSLLPDNYTRYSTIYMFLSKLNRAVPFSTTKPEAQQSGQLLPALFWLAQSEKVEKDVLYDTVHHPSYGMLALIAQRAKKGGFHYSFYLPLSEVIQQSNPSTAYSFTGVSQMADKTRMREEELVADINKTASSPLPHRAFFEEPSERSARLAKLRDYFLQEAGSGLTETPCKGIIFLSTSWRRTELYPNGQP
jgi:hypothetical protein